MDPPNATSVDSQHPGRGEWEARLRRESEAGGEHRAGGGPERGDAQTMEGKAAGEAGRRAKPPGYQSSSANSLALQSSPVTSVSSSVKWVQQL